jgi:hypothetical protein
VITINVKLYDGRTVAICPHAVGAFEEVYASVAGGPADLLVPAIRLVDGTVYVCERQIVPVGMNLPQSVALANAFSSAIERVGRTLDTRSKLVGRG